VTERLYYTDAYLTSFDASIVETTTTDDGRTGVVLDRTAFYPTSGGQPFDLGTLGAARVVEVVDLDDGRILHVIEGDPGSERVAGRIEWERRFDHMQQHTGQHVLSAAFDHVSGARTVSFHLGAAASTIDLATEVSPAEIARCESEANRIVWEDRPVSIRVADAAEAARLPLRKETARTGPLRLIDVQDFDLSACGGTHVARTGAIGIVAVASWERFRGGTRLEFVCGSRALTHYRTLRDSVASAIRHLSVAPPELAAAIERLQTDAKDQKRRLKDLQGRMAVHEAAALSAAAERIGDVMVVAATLDGWDQGASRAAASAIVGTPGHLAVLLTGPAPFNAIVARSADVRADASALLKSLTTKFGGKGGGKAGLAQGGGLQGAADEILAHARAVVAGHGSG
jgi:alanyl-tRNA synthetase